MNTLRNKDTGMLITVGQEGSSSYIQELEGGNDTQLEHIREAHSITPDGKLDRKTRMVPDIKIKQEVMRTRTKLCTEQRLDINW